MARKLKNLENETQTLYDLEYGKKTGKRGKCDINTVGPGVWRENSDMRKMRNIHGLTWNMARNSE